VPTIFTHAVSGLAIGSLYRSQRPRRFWMWTAVCAFPLGIPYDHLLGHRGVSHSLAFAALVGAVAAWTWGRGSTRWALFLHFFVVTASHGVLDAFTNGGLGVAFFAPFNDTRYFFPWRPIQVSPIGVGFFIARDRNGESYGFRVLASEFWWVWLPSAALVLTGWAFRTRRSAR
jgi:inner membrane protein